jgi:hypothetical protein
MRVTLVVVLVGLAAGCADRSPARIASHRGDTVVVNSRRPTPLAARVLDKAGRELPSATVTWRYVQGNHYTIDDSGRVICDHRGEVRVRATSGTVQREITVLCRPIATVRLGSSLVLRPGEESDAYDMGGRGPDGLPVLEVAGVASIRDTSVAVLRNGTIVARSIGRTAVDLEAGDCRSVVGVDVELPVDSAHRVAEFRPFEETLTLAPGEVRSWRPSTGLTLVHLFGDSAVTASLSFGVLDANCARLRREYRAVSCVMNAASVVALRNPPGSEAARVRLRLERVVPPKPQRPSKRSEAREAANALCPQYFG